MHNIGVIAGRKRINLEPGKMRVIQEEFSKRLKPKASRLPDPDWSAICFMSGTNQPEGCLSTGPVNDLYLFEKTLIKHELLATASEMRKNNGLLGNR